MKFNRVAARVVAAALFAVSAAQVNAAEGWYQDYIKTIYPLSTGDFVVTFVNSPASCLNTSNPKYFHVEAGKNGVTTDGVKAMLATSLTAYAAGKRLTVVFDDTSTSCSVNRMVISD